MEEFHTYLVMSLGLRMRRKFEFVLTVFNDCEVTPRSSPPSLGCGPHNFRRLNERDSLSRWSLLSWIGGRIIYSISCLCCDLRIAVDRIELGFNCSKNFGLYK